MNPLHAFAGMLLVIALLIAIAAITAHIEYRKRFPIARGRELDHMGMDWDCPRKPRESDRRYRLRLRLHLSPRRHGPAAGTGRR